jgi:hypothetical protein
MLYVIVEYISYPESPECKIVCVVDDNGKAQEIVDRLSESVEEFNEIDDLTEVSYYYEEFELNNIDIIDSFIKKNKDGKVYEIVK